MNGPPIIFETGVSEDWIDYNGHMTEYAYSLIFGKAIDVFITELGIGRSYCETTGRTVYTLAAQISFVREVTAGMSLEVDLMLLDMADDVIHVFQRMFDTRHELKATYESVIAHVNQRPRPKVEPYPMEILEKMRKMRDRHSAFGWPARAGTPLGIRRPA